MPPTPPPTGPRTTKKAHLPSRAGDVPSSSVHPIETPQRPCLLEELDHSAAVRKSSLIRNTDERTSRFWHSDWQPTRERVYVALMAAGRPAVRVERFRCCGAAPRLFVAEDEAKLHAQFCHDRWCQTCQRRAAAHVRQQLMTAFRPGDTRLVTLTLRHGDTPLKAQIKRLRTSFQALRRDPVWSRNCDGGAAMVEVIIGRDGRWHPHLHILVVGRWMDQRELSRAWHSITGDSSIVDVRACSDDGHAVVYVSKYLTKPVSHDIYRDPRKLAEAVQALHHVKMLSSFGTWKHIRLRKREPDPDPARWRCVGSPADILAGLVPDADRWLAVLFRLCPKQLANLGLTPDSS